MDRAAYQAQYAQYAAMTERRLEELCDQYLPAQARIAAAARYSLLGGGKRVRAVLALAGCALCGRPAAQALDFAVVREPAARKRTVAVRQPALSDFSDPFVSEPVLYRFDGFSKTDYICVQAQGIRAL